VKARRILTALTLAVLALAALTACKSKVGQAAAVDDTTITDNGVSSYVEPGTTPYNDSNGQRVVPKLLVLTTWVRTQLLNEAIANKGGDPSTGELNQARAAVQTTGTIEQAEQAYAKLGYKNKFGDLLFDQYTRLVLLVERLTGTTDAAKAFQLLQSNQAANIAVSNAIRKTNAHVDISPRYGTWDPSTLSVSSQASSGAPPFVDFSATS
jgi:hypothetical protein